MLNKTTDNHFISTRSVHQILSLSRPSATNMINAKHSLTYST